MHDHAERADHVPPAQSLRRQCRHRLTRRGQIAVQTAKIIMIRGRARDFRVVMCAHLNRLLRRAGRLAGSTSTIRRHVGRDSDRSGFLPTPG